jgi:hypothetical protein
MEVIVAKKQKNPEALAGLRVLESFVKTQRARTLRLALGERQ